MPLKFYRLEGGGLEPYAWKINQRLLSEIISHPAFKHLLIDTEIYVDGFFEESLQSNNTLMDFARKEISRKHGDTEDSIKGSLNLIHLHQNDYFSQILAKDLLPILEDIKDAHKDDTETSDGGYTMDELEQAALDREVVFYTFSKENWLEEFRAFFR